MAMLLFLMAAIPGGIDSKQMATAWHHYNDSPNDITRKEIADARIADRKQMVKIELVLGTFLTASAIVFFRLGRKTKSPLV
jgi:hypothetical protein